VNLQHTCRTLHLAFQNLPYDEVYNILAGMVLKAIHGYDPEYTAKIREVVMAIQLDPAALMGDQMITADDFDPSAS